LKLSPPPALLGCYHKDGETPAALGALEMAKKYANWSGLLGCQGRVSNVGWSISATSTM